MKKLIMLLMLAAWVVPTMTFAADEPPKTEKKTKKKTTKKKTEKKKEEAPKKEG